MIRSLALIALVWTGCSRHEAPADAVNRYFKAIAAGDCAVAGPLLADEHANCQGMYEDYRENEVAFQGVQKIEPDGRDPKVMLVSARMRYKRNDHVWVIRVEDHGGHWKLRF